MCRNVMAREKALFPGHPVAAVAATTEAIAAEGLRADRGRLRGAAVVDRDRRRDEARRADPARVQQVRGQAVQHRRPPRASRRATSREGFKEADVVVERSFTTRPVHQGYIEPHACLISVAPDSKTTIWSSSQGQFMVRAMTALSDRHPAERHPRHPGRDRRRLWRQDHRLSRAARDAAGEKIRPSGQDGDDPRGSDARDRPDLGLEEHGQDRRDQGRHDRRRAGHLLSAGRRLPGLADPRRGRLQLRALRHPERALGRLRRALQPLEGRGLSRAGRADRRLCGRMRDRRSSPKR